MNRWEIITGGVLPGALAGVAGGLVFGASMVELGSLPSVASLVRVDSPVVGFIVHMAIAATVGAGFGVLMWHQRPGFGETLFWGLAYGTLWWFIGALTLNPLFIGGSLAWSVESAQSAFPALIGHVLYGAGAGLAIALLRWREQTRGEETTITVGAVLRGGLAGLLAFWMVGAALASQGQLPAFTAGMAGDSRLALWLVTLLVGLLAGVGFALLYPHPTDGSGAAVIRGAVYGFLWWTVVPLSVLPILKDSVLPWSLSEVRELFPTLPAYVLSGAATALFYQWLGVLVRLLFSDFVPGGDQEGVGTQGLRALTRGVASGVVGGLVFTGVMVQVGFLEQVASLIGATSPVTGFFVHLVIAILVGSSYGLLFHRQSYDIGSALGWGVSYGFIWWLVGPLTLMPIFLGSTPQWTADAAAQVFPNLVGHLGYGAGLGITFHLLEARYNPWWIPRRQALAAGVQHRKEQVLTSAPALWTLVVVISLTLPILLGTEAAVPGLPYQP